MDEQLSSGSQADGPHMDAIHELEREKERLQDEVVRLVKEKAVVQERLDFVEELFGPTEAQRKVFQDQFTTARNAALQAHRNGAPVPVRFVGRLDEIWLRFRGLNERDCALLQRGCLTSDDGVSTDVSMLGDPGFKPYDEETHEPIWEACGGMLKLSLDDVRQRWGEEVAMEVVRCASELDKYDASRRLGSELPWHEAEAREMEPAEVIALLEQELCATRCCRTGSNDIMNSTGTDEASSEVPSLDPAEEGSSDSPTWSMFEGSEHVFDDTGNDGWSFADGDIDQLLRAQRKHCDVPRSLVSSPREEFREESALFSGSEEFDDENMSEESAQWEQGCDELEPTRGIQNRDEELGEVLRELLEEEVGGPLGHLFTQSPPLS